ISMDTVKIEPVTVGNEVSSTSVEIKPEPVRQTEISLLLCGNYTLSTGQDESLQCFQCLITFSNSKVKERHIKKFHGDQYKQHLQQKNTLFTCYRCDKCFFTSGELSQHQATHSREEKPFCCGYCRKEFCTFSELNKHRREECTECMERRCPCKDCGALFPNSERLLNHRIAMHPECLVVVRDMNAYQCSKCSQCFQTEDELVNHQEESACNVNHDVKLQGKKRGHNSKMMLMWRLLLTRKSRRSRGLETQIELKIPCSETGCDFVFPSVEALRTHACTECDQRYTRLEQLSAHMASIHQSGYTCNTCGKCFAQESLLKTHQKTHRKKEEVAEQR
uniref:C2H2-type domain-containing protein n=1 Tax=Takifugu rubripes TaxID=31033 RepID=A0A674MS27_TAKRU